MTTYAPIPVCPGTGEVPPGGMPYENLWLWGSQEIPGSTWHRRELNRLAPAHPTRPLSFFLYSRASPSLSLSLPSLALSLSISLSLYTCTHMYLLTYLLTNTPHTHTHLGIHLAATHLLVIKHCLMYHESMKLSGVPAPVCPQGFVVYCY